MNIIHIINMANVGGILAKYQRRLGHEVMVVNNGNGDKFKTVEYGGIINIPDSKFPSSDTVAFARQYEDWADIFHVHALPEEIERVREYAGKKPVILHIHGSDMETMTSKVQTQCDAVLVSTPNLWKEGFTYLPNPIDLEMWEKRTHQGKDAVWFKQWDGRGYIEGEVIVRQVAKELDLNLSVIERWKEYIPYMNMPQWYHEFDKFIEYKHEVDYDNNVKGRTLGLAALEAIASGLPVYFVPERKWLTEFPREHEAMTVVKKLDDLYNKVV